MLDECAIKKKKLKIYLNNINGSTCKQTSLNNIIKLKQPSIICLTETKVTRLKSFNFKGYNNVIARNVKKGKGGMLVALRNNTATTIMDTTSVDNKNIMSVEVMYGKTVYRIILCYGPQEDHKVEERNEFYVDLSIEIENSLINGSTPIILGDFNAKIKMSGESTEAVSGNGMLLCKVLQTFDLKVCNFHEKANGTYTRIRNKKGKTEKSTLDYIITTNSMINNLSSFTIDEEKIETPFRLVKVKGGSVKAVYSDHCALSASFLVSHEKTAETPVKRWIINKKGLEKFSELTEPPFYHIRSDVNVDTNYNQYMQKLKETMGKCFEEKEMKEHDELYTAGKKLKTIIKNLRMYRKKGKIQRQVADYYVLQIKTLLAEKVHLQNINRLREAYEKLGVDGKFSSNMFWKLSKSVCKRQSENKSSIVVNGSTEIFGEIAIIDAYKEEFTYRLRNRKIEDGMEDFQKSLELLVSLYLQHAETIKTQDEFTMDELVCIIKNLATKKAPGADGITTELLKAAGTGLRQGLLDIFNYMKQNTVVPQQWENVVVVTLYKGKGKRKELINYRGIFLTSIMCKIFEKLIKSRVDNILNRVSKFQAGAKTNRSTNDQLFLLHGAVDHLIYLNQSIYITFYDFRQAFDSLWLKDCILSLWELGIQNSYLSLIYKLNQKAMVTVNTPYGKTTPFVVDQIVKQGAVLASDICSVSTGEICLTEGTPVGLLSLPPLAFVDDIATLNTKVKDVMASHARMIGFGKLKKLVLNETKCYGLLINEKKNETFPNLYINDELIQSVNSTKYLGDILNRKNSNEDMIIERENKAIGKLVSIFATVSETTFGAFQFDALILMYHSYFLPALIFNCQSWTNISTKDMSKLRTLQLKFLKRTLRVPQATANSFVFLETGIIPIDHEIWRRQFTFLHHILTLEENDPVKVMYKQMLSLPGERNWANKISHLKQVYDISLSDNEICEMDVEKFKTIVNTKIRAAVFIELVIDCSAKSKTNQLQYKSFEQQKYLTAFPSTVTYNLVRIRCSMLNTIHDRPYLHPGVKKCRVCNFGDESLRHIMNCYMVSDQINSVPTSIYTNNINEYDAKNVTNMTKKFYDMVDELTEVS